MYIYVCLRVYATGCKMEEVFGGHALCRRALRLSQSLLGSLSLLGASSHIGLVGENTGLVGETTGLVGETTGLF